MIQHYWTIPCRLSLTDRESNNVTLVEIVEEISLPELPIRPGVAPNMVPAIFDIVFLYGAGRIRIFRSLDLAGYHLFPLRGKRSFFMSLK